MGSEPSPIFSFLPLIFMFAIFYFLLIRPQKKKQDNHRKFVQSLEKNLEVVTTGGLHGTITQVKDNSVVLRVSDNVKVEFDRSAIARSKKEAAV